MYKLLLKIVSNFPDEVQTYSAPLYWTITSRNQGVGSTQNNYIHLIDFSII
jgi:hypothetical protein